jgi:hypothetical protein
MSWLSEAKNKFLTFPTVVRVAVIAFFVGAIVGGMTCRAWRKAVIEEPPPVEEQFGQGWIDDPERVTKIVATFKTPFFGDAAKGIIQQEQDKDALLYNIYRKVHGHPWKPHNQGSVGSCVGHGASGATELLSCCQIANGEHDEYQHVSAAAIYALSREVDNFLGNQDGSTGAAAAKAMMEYGHLFCKDAGDDNYDTSIGPPLCKKWGRTGLPKDLKSIAAKYRVKTAAKVRTPEEVRAALVNGYPVTIASSVGFEGKGGHKRDADGFCYAGGTWAHQMFVGAYRADKKAFLVFNSWGPNMPTGPKSLDQPDGTFWITWKDMQRITTSGECYALSGFDGFPQQNIDVFIQRPQRREYTSLWKTLRVKPCVELAFSPSSF